MINIRESNYTCPYNAINFSLSPLDHIKLKPAHSSCHHLCGNSKNTLFTVPIFKP